MRSFIFRSLFVILLSGGAVFSPVAAGDSPNLIPAGKYAEVVSREIDVAQQSVHVCMYLFACPANGPRSGPSQLLESLLRAQKRGVRVQVLLNTSGPGFEEIDRNGYVAEILMRGGVEVTYSQGPILHAKTVVVDAQTIVLGSSNWTLSALGKNNEADILWRSTATAAALLRRWAEVSQRPLSPADTGMTVAIPVAFLKPPHRMGEMVRRKDTGALDLALHLFSRGTSTTTWVGLDVPVAVRALGYPDQGPVANRRRLHKVLTRLEKIYGLVELKESYDHDPQCRWRSTSSSVSIGLPQTYFDYGWDRRLTLPGKAFLLMNLHQSQTSPMAPLWSKSRNTLSQEYGVAKDAVGKGSIDLRRNNLLEVSHSHWSDDAMPRRPNQYRPAPMGDPRVTDQVFAELQERYGAAVLARARSIAGLLYEDRDTRTVEKLIALELRHGEKMLARAVKTLGELSADNPRRHLGYLEGIIENMSQAE